MTTTVFLRSNWFETIDARELINWLAENLDVDEWFFKSEYYAGAGSKYVFKNEADALAFKMKFDL